MLSVDPRNRLVDIGMYHLQVLQFAITAFHQVHLVHMRLQNELVHSTLIDVVSLVDKI